jgi:hypothetical protein
MFEALGIQSAYAGAEPLYLYTYTWGLGVSGLRKGYIYTTDPNRLVPGHIVGSTERNCRAPCYRQIDEDWYIYQDD